MSAVAMQTAILSSRRKSCWLGTPEIYFRKSIDNSRLVKVEDPRREREMKQFGLALGCLFLLVMGGALRLEEASLRDPERIDSTARRLGLQPPAPGQVLRMDVGNDAAVPVM